MKNNKIIIYLVLVFTLTLGNFLSCPKFTEARQENYQKAVLLVKLKDSSEILKFEFNDNVSLDKVIDEYKNNDSVEYVEPNYLVKISAFPNDPDYNLQWYLNPINIRDFWSTDLLLRQNENNSAKSVIAILDTGVDIDHPDLKDKIWGNSKEVSNDGIDNDGNGFIDDVNGWNFVDNNNNPNPAFPDGYDTDAVKHGTIVAGIAGAATNNSQGIAGVGWFVKIMPLKVLGSDGTGDIYSVVQAIDYAIKNGANVINMSFVGTGYSQSLLDAIRRAYNKDLLIVAAAGNTDPQTNGVDLDLTPSYPVCFDGVAGENMVVGVASVGKDLKKSAFSNYGRCVDLVAPGEGFYSTQVYKPDKAGFYNYYDGYWSGTSLSAPLVSGMLAAMKALRPHLKAEQIKSLLLENTQDISNANLEYKNKLGKGLLDAGKIANTVSQAGIFLEQKEKINYIIAALGQGSFPQLRVFKSDGSVFKEFYPYDPKFKGVIYVASGDVNGDGINEIITGQGVGGGPEVRIFNIDGQLMTKFLAYGKSFRGGVNVSVGDVNGDKKAEIITGPGKGNIPEVKIFDSKGNLVNKFLAYDKKFLGGVKVGSADFNHDGKAEIASGTGVGGGPHVKLFKANGDLLVQFFAFNSASSGGVNIACSDIHGDGQPEIITSQEYNSSPLVRVYTYQGRMLDSFFAYDQSVAKGVNVAVGDIDNDGVPDIITAKGIGGDSKIRIFDHQGKIKSEFFAYNKNYLGGVRLGIIRY
jgi:hypothetical protein